MLDRLPPEIIDYMLEIAFPSPDWPLYPRRAESERVESLQSLALVCKAVSERSQRHWYRELYFAEDWHGSEFEEGCSKERTKELVKVVETIHADDFYPGQIGSLAWTFKQLRKSYISECQKPFNLRNFAECPNANLLFLPLEDRQLTPD